MRHLTTLDGLSLPAAWATIGSFDGVHRGHQAIIENLVQGAHQSGVPAVVITFFPHPSVVLRGPQGPFFLTTPEERAELLDALGVDIVVTLHFDRQMAALSAEEFMRMIAGHLGLRRLLVGYNFALGRGREGNVDRLRELGEQMGYTLELTRPFELGGEVVSSSRIRALLNRGSASEAAQLLGRPYTLSGEVVHGDGRGHGLGIPTANLSVWQERIIPAVGVYATWAVIDGTRHPAVTNIGVRPTFENEPVFARIETHLLDYDRDLYGQKMQLQFIQYLRREQRFPSIQALLDQIHQDIDQTREVLEHAD
jgi:riboflavin kinase/FMN adenylyltransferase